MKSNIGIFVIMYLVTGCASISETPKEWKFVFKRDNGREIYVDKPRMTEGNMLSYKVLINIPKGQPPSGVTELIYSCESKKTNIKSITLFSEPMGKGKGQFIHTPANTWFDGLENSPVYILGESACVVHRASQTYKKSN